MHLLIENSLMGLSLVINYNVTSTRALGAHTVVSQALFHNGGLGAL